MAPPSPLSGSALGLLFRFAAPGLALVAASGCVSTRVDYLDPALTPEKLSESRIALAGVVARPEVGTVWEGEEREIMSELERVLRKKRPDAGLMGYGEFQAAAGPGRSVLTGSRDNLLLARYGSRDLARAKREGATHAMPLELERNEVLPAIEQHCDHDTRYVYDDEGNVVSCYTETTYYTYARMRRLVEARYHLYDLETLRPVWVTWSGDAGLRSNSRCSGICYPPPPPFPRPPGVSGVVEGMTRAVVREMPQEKGGWFSRWTREEPLAQR